MSTFQLILTGLDLAAIIAIFPDIFRFIWIRTGAWFFPALIFLIGMAGYIAVYHMIIGIILAIVGVIMVLGRLSG